MSEVVLEIGAPETPEVDHEADLDELDELDATDVPGHVTEDMVRGLLAGVGLLADQIAPEHLALELTFTEDELDGLVPPLTRIINRRPALVAAVHRGDELTVATYLAGYVGRNYSNARRAHEDREREAGALARPGRADARGDGRADDGRRVDDAAPGAGFHPPTGR